MPRTVRPRRARTGPGLDSVDSIEEVDHHGAERADQALVAQWLDPTGSGVDRCDGAVERVLHVSEAVEPLCDREVLVFGLEDASGGIDEVDCGAAQELTGIAVRGGAHLDSNQWDPAWR